MRGKKVKKLLGVMALCVAIATIMPISVLAEDTVQDDNAGQVQEATQEEGEQNEIRENGQELDESDSDNRENSEDSIMLADEKEDILNVKYSAYLHGMDWQEEKSNGEMAGTVGQNRAVEAYEIRLENNTGISGTIQYRAHVSNIGWQEYVEEGGLAGTT